MSEYFWSSSLFFTFEISGSALLACENLFSVTPRGPWSLLSRGGGPLLHSHHQALLQVPQHCQCLLHRRRQPFTPSQLSSAGRVLIPCAEGGWMHWKTLMLFLTSMLRQWLRQVSSRGQRRSLGPSATLASKTKTLRTPGLIPDPGPLFLSSQYNSSASQTTPKTASSVTQVPSSSLLAATLSTSPVLRATRSTQSHRRSSCSTSQTPAKPSTRPSLWGRYISRLRTHTMRTSGRHTARTPRTCWATKEDLRVVQNGLVLTSCPVCNTRAWNFFCVGCASMSLQTSTTCSLGLTTLTPSSGFSLYLICASHEKNWFQGAPCQWWVPARPSPSAIQLFRRVCQLCHPRTQPIPQLVLQGTWRHKLLSTGGQFSEGTNSSHFGQVSSQWGSGKGQKGLCEHGGSWWWKRRGDGVESPAQSNATNQTDLFPTLFFLWRARESKPFEGGRLGRGGRGTCKACDGRGGRSWHKISASSTSPASQPLSTCSLPSQPVSTSSQPVSTCNLQPANIWGDEDAEKLSCSWVRELQQQQEVRSKSRKTSDRIILPSLFLMICCPCLQRF